MSLYISRDRCSGAENCQNEVPGKVAKEAEFISDAVAFPIYVRDSDIEKSSSVNGSNPSVSNLPRNVRRICSE